MAIRCYRSILRSLTLNLNQMSQASIWQSLYFRYFTFFEVIFLSFLDRSATSLFPLIRALLGHDQ